MILVVEDDPVLRESIVAVLESAGYETAEAGNGRQALVVLRGAVGPRVSLVLLDLAMPVLDGWAFRRAQLADPKIAAVPVIVASAWAGDGARPVAGLPRLRKPFTPAALLAEVMKLCPTRAAPPFTSSGHNTGETAALPPPAAARLGPFR